MQDASPMVTGFDPSFIALVAIVGGVIFLSIMFFMIFLTAILKDRQKEMTTREIAAYVAEGSITSEDAERILRGSRPMARVARDRPLQRLLRLGPTARTRLARPPPPDESA